METGTKMIIKIIEKKIICNRTNRKLPERKSCSGIVICIFKNSKLFEGQILLTKKNRTSQTGKKKVHRIIESFSLLSDVLLILLTTCVQDTALNQCRWCDMEGNRYGRHVLDHWTSHCVGDNRCKYHVFDYWRTLQGLRKMQTSRTRSLERALCRWREK